ncbi:heme A synthase [Hyphomicrobium methylovorum]|uniref:COX15/CtaA family protein n=1 Tax=Hyphomicrobium methylovorum TaxID=84 RepID=UPI0015E76EF2|nr:COX15/CtaA family protein [Hyphomicrobium methylovorum]MBA2127641.1 heme A synthase [Hyphomicrobium methylovorum]
MTMAPTIDQQRTRNADREGVQRAVSLWLWFVAALVVAMIIVGGATRLTESGLSITEWQPLLGAIPPLDESHWIEAFEKYKLIPQYHIMNHGMTLEEFKFIYWWEWSHRFLGRFIGLAFALPLLAFWVTGSLKRGSGVKFLGVLALGGLQGVIGWYMVKSGLVDRIDVSQYRLALHLTTAFLILGLLVWLALEEWPNTSAPTGEAASLTVRRMATFLLVIVIAQVVLGAFVAGLKAGFIYNTWPTMNGQWVPSDYWTTPWYLSFFESHAASQFNHRMLAYLVGIAALVEVWLVWGRRFDRRIQTTAIALAVVVFAQMGLGIATLLTHVQLDVALLHQAGGAIVLTLAVLHLYVVRHRGTSQIAAGQLR